MFDCYKKWTYEPNTPEKGKCDCDSITDLILGRGGKTMKKCIFFKIMQDSIAANHIEIQKTEGWEETIFDANGKKITLCLEKNAYDCWSVTEKTTGCAICDGATRKEAIEKVKIFYLDTIYDNIINVPKTYKTLIKKAYLEV